MLIPPVCEPRRRWLPNVPVPSHGTMCKHNWQQKNLPKKHQRAIALILPGALASPASPPHPLFRSANKSFALGNPLRPQRGHGVAKQELARQAPITMAAVSEANRVSSLSQLCLGAALPCPGELPAAACHGSRHFCCELTPCIESCCESLCVRVRALQVKELPTKPIEGQKTGTSGLRKKTKVGLQAGCLQDRLAAPVPAVPRPFLGLDLCPRELELASGGFLGAACSVQCAQLVANCAECWSSSSLPSVGILTLSL